MARGRFLSRSEASDRKVRAMISKLQSPWPGVFHPRLIAWLDVNGNVIADKYWLKGNIHLEDPEVSPDDCELMVDAMVEFGLAQDYRVGNVRYLHFPKFDEHQIGLRKDREKPEVPAPQWQTDAVPPDGIQKTGSGTEGGGNDGGKAREKIRHDSAKMAHQYEGEVEEEVEEKEEVEEQKKKRRPGGRDSGPSPGMIVPVGNTERMTAQELVGFWIDHLRERPPGDQIGKQGAAARRLCEKYSRAQVAQAAVGITQLFPHSHPKNEPWDLFDLERKFAKALEAAHNHPDARTRSYVESLEGVDLATFGTGAAR